MNGISENSTSNGGKKKWKTALNVVNAIMTALALSVLAWATLIDYMADRPDKAPEIAVKLQKKVPSAFDFPDVALTYHVGGTNEWRERQFKKNLVIAKIINHDAMLPIRRLFDLPDNLPVLHGQTYMSLRKNGTCHLNWEPRDFSEKGMWSSVMHATFSMEGGQKEQLMELTLLHELAHCHDFIRQGERFDRKYGATERGTFISENFADGRSLVLFAIANPDSDWKKIAHAFLVARVSETRMSLKYVGEKSVHDTTRTIAALMKSGIPEDLFKHPNNAEIDKLVDQLMRDGGVFETSKSYR